jgi:hypothetical protein
MLFSRHLATWILLSTTTIFQCDYETCMALGAPLSKPQKIHTFAARTDCEDLRAVFADLKLPVVSNPARPEQTIRQQITYVCKEGA